MRNHVVIPGREISGFNQWDQSWTPQLQKEIEKHWADRIEEFEFDENSEKEKFYVLSMFPYPSGNLHMGHVRVYCLSDVYARFQRLKGRNVIHPMGWDAFGLPAENAAIERNLNPDLWTQKNIEHMKSLLERLNLSFDWNREFATCDSDYYKWTQYLFLKLYESGLVYRKEAFVNWDPVDQTVLADEQVSEDGRSWRSGSLVEKKLRTQWFIRTTRYCESLFEGLSDPTLEKWGKVVNMQKKWIGRANGITLDFDVVENECDLKHQFVTVWLNKPEYVHKIKFIAVQTDSIWNSGTVVSGKLPYKVRNPLSGEIVPVYATNFFAFPEGRDNYAGMPEVVEADEIYAQSVNLKYSVSDRVIATEEELAEYRREICEEAQKMGVGGYPVSSRIRDWLISRQRYWGTPIPIIYCDNCGEQPVPEEDLPVKLPNVKETQKGRNELSNVDDWVNTKCPKCGGEARRETDTMDTFVDSSWYYLRFLDPDNVNAPFSLDKARKYMPVDLYIGGLEHATLHMYYARFFNHFLYSAGLVEHREPFKRLLPQGIVRGKTYQRACGDYVKPEEVEFVEEGAVHKATGEKLTVSWEKMSKSKYNGVEPEKLLNTYGADMTRLTVLADVGPMDPRDWSEDTFRGIMNWMWRLWTLVSRFREVRSKDGLETPQDLDEINLKFFDSRNYAVEMVEHSYDVTLNASFCIRKLQTLSNQLKTVSDGGIMHSLQFERALAILIIMLAPMAPSFASELWAGYATAPNRIGNTGEVQWDQPVFKQSWPKVDSNYVSKLRSDGITAKQSYDRQRKLKQRAEKKALVEETEACSGRLEESRRT